MNKGYFKALMKSAKADIVAHSPEILTGLGVAGMVTSIIFSVKATPKALELIEEKKVECRKERTAYRPVVDTVKATWKCYVPTIAVASTSIACIIGANAVQKRRHVALLAAYDLSTTAFAEYREKVKEVVGEKKHEKVVDAIAKKHAEEEPQSTSSEVYITGKGETLFKDSLFKSYFKSDINTVQQAFNKINYELMQERYISLNELYFELGIPQLEAHNIGDDLGWNVDNGLIEYQLSPQIEGDGTIVVMVEFIEPPVYDYKDIY